MIDPGDVFGAPVVLLPVSCDGRMGAGVNLRARMRYPRWYAAYQADCSAGMVRLGMARTYHLAIGHWVIALPIFETAASSFDRAVLVAALASVPKALVETGHETIFVDARSLGVAQIGQDAITDGLREAFGRHVAVWLQLPERRPARQNVTGKPTNLAHVPAGNVAAWRDHVLAVRSGQTRIERRTA